MKSNLKISGVNIVVAMYRWFMVPVICVTSILPSVYPIGPPPSIKCPPGLSYFPDPSDCSAYYICAHRRLRRMLCTAGEEYSVSIKNCQDSSIANCNKQCEALKNNANGKWDPPSCSAGPNTVGSVCSIKCTKKYELRGSSSINCADSGWNSTNGNFIPKCVEVECISEDMKNAMNDTLTVNSGMLFVVDESGSIGPMDFIKSKEFVKHIVNKFPLSESRTAGVITFDDYPIVRIPLTESSTDNFKREVDKIPYRGEGTDVLEAMECALQEIQRSRPGYLYLVILITDGISETNPGPGADALKNASHPIFAIGIGRKRLNYLEDLASDGKNGIKHFFHTRSYEVLESIGYYINNPPEEAKKKCA